MEIIKNYLETMFANLPNTEGVQKAKNELLQMMEDKYNELIENGETENSAVGTVISEFGNLDELADELGIGSELASSQNTADAIPRRKISLEEAKEFLAARSASGLRLGIGVMLCITSVVGPMLFDVTQGLTAVGLGAALMFFMIAVGVALFIYNGAVSKKWKYVKTEACQIDMQTAGMLQDEKRKYGATNALCVAIGVVFCAFCWLPNTVAVAGLNLYIQLIAASLLFVMVGLGVLLLIYTNTKMKSYDILLKVNNAATVSGHYTEDQKPAYRNALATLIMELYWPFVVCIYFIISFLTFRWDVTGLIWPIAVGLFFILKACLRNND